MGIMGGLNKAETVTKVAGREPDRRAVAPDGAVLPSWNDTATRAAVIAFVEGVTREGSESYVPRPERIAVFDNDGTLWCEKPMPVELWFMLERLSAMAEADPSLRTRQPWKAAHEKDYGWLGGAIEKHYTGDDSAVRALLGGALQAFAGWPVENYAAAADAFIRNGRHPTLGRAFRDCGYKPMIELLRYLESKGFTTYIASGGNRDFMRSFAQDVYGVPPERVIGSSSELRYQGNGNGGSVVYRAAPDVFDDGAAKPVRIWSRVGRHPILAAGNSNGDLPMLQFTGEHPGRSLRLLVHHDDPVREFDYTGGAKTAIAQARSGGVKEGWVTISVKDDWATVFADAG